jgi:low temperature requirement protein LtrA
MRESTRRRPRVVRLQEATEYASERHATWTELFFDLVFVVAVAQLAAGLHDHLSVTGAATFVGLFVPVVWTWTTYAYLGDLFDADEGLFRLVLLAAMLLVAGFAATIPSAFDGRSTGYVVAYALLRADIVALYAWAWWTDPALRVLARKHALGLGLGLLVWVASLALDEPARYAVWALAIACDLGTGVAVYRGAADVPRQRSHMPERFGLFTLIVLGESIIAVSVGTAHADWAAESLVTAATGFALAAALWWMYFARFDDDVFNWGADRRARRAAALVRVRLRPPRAVSGPRRGGRRRQAGDRGRHRARLRGSGGARPRARRRRLSAQPLGDPGGGAARARALLVVGALAVAAFGTELSPALVVALTAAGASCAATL